MMELQRNLEYLIWILPIGWQVLEIEDSMNMVMKFEAMRRKDNASLSFMLTNPILIPT